MLPTTCLCGVGIMQNTSSIILCHYGQGQSRTRPTLYSLCTSFPMLKNQVQTQLKHTMFKQGCLVNVPNQNASPGAPSASTFAVRQTVVSARKIPFTCVNYPFCVRAELIVTTQIHPFTRAKRQQRAIIACTWGWCGVGHVKVAKHLCFHPYFSLFACKCVRYTS